MFPIVSCRRAMPVENQWIRDPLHETRGVYRLASFLLSWRPPKRTLHLICSSELIEEQPSHVSRTLRIRVRMKARKYIIAVFQPNLDRNWSKHVISSSTLPATQAGTNWHNCWVVLHTSVTKWTQLVIIPSAIFKPQWHPKSSQWFRYSRHESTWKTR